MGPPLIKTTPAVYKPRDDRTTKLIESQEPNVRFLLSEGLVSLAELGYIATIMDSPALLRSFGQLMSSNSWQKQVVCKVEHGEKSDLKIMVFDGSEKPDLSGETYVPACWAKAVLHLLDNGFRSACLMHGRHFASEHVYLEGLIPAGAGARWLHQQSIPCDFVVTNIPFNE